MVDHILNTSLTYNCFLEFLLYLKEKNKVIVIKKKKVLKY